MAKTIKFNLICDGNSVRTIADLQQNFSIEDILEYYHNKLLHRWLKVRGYEDQLQKVSNITTEDTLTILKNLIAIFEIENDEDTIRKNTFILEYRKEREVLLEKYKKMDFQILSIIDDHNLGYRKIIKTILDNKNDISQIKAAIIEIEQHYYSLFKFNYRHLFYTLYNQAPLAIFCLLMNSSMRDFYLPKDDEKISDDKKHIYDHLCNLMTHNKLVEKLQNNLKEFSGVTDGYWKDVEAKDSQYMILSMESGNFVRSTGVSGADLGYSDIKNKFVILKGIDYKSNTASHKLLYMEV